MSTTVLDVKLNSVCPHVITAVPQSHYHKQKRKRPSCTTEKEKTELYRVRSLTSVSSEFRRKNRMIRVQYFCMDMK